MLWQVVAAVALVIHVGCFMVVFANAVKQSPIKGLCCLIVPFYIFLFYFDGFDHSKKTLIGAGWLGGLVVGLGILFSVAYGG